MALNQLLGTPFRKNTHFWLVYNQNYNGYNLWENFFEFQSEFLGQNMTKQIFSYTSF